MTTKCATFCGHTPYDPDVKRSRNVVGWIAAFAVIVAAAVVVWVMMGFRSRAEQLLDRGPSAPAPSAGDAEAMTLTSDGVRLTIKQRDSAWLPGGKFKLHLDDITGQQVIVSVTDTSGRVTLSPKSVKHGDGFEVADMEITVVRLENLLVGSGDFGEFEVLPKP